MTEKKEKLPSTNSTDNFSSTANLTDFDYKIRVDSIDSINDKEYEPYEHRQIEHPNTFTGALMHMLKTSLGTGILAIPSAIKSAGLIVGVIGTLFVGIICAHTIHVLVSASQQICKKAKVPMLGFSETAYEVFNHAPGKLQKWASFAKIFVDGTLLLTYYSATAVYVVFISTNIQALVEYHYPSVEDWALQYYMLMLYVPLCICCQIRQLKHIVPFSIIANTTMIVAFIITLYYIFSEIGDINVEDRKLSNDIALLPLFFSTVLYAIEGIGTMLPIENSMLKQQFLGCPGVLNIGMTCVVSLYTIIGIFGYLTFGDEVKANIIANLPVGEIPAQVAKACIAVAVFFTFMLQFYVPCNIAWRKLAPRVPERHHNIAQIILRIVSVSFIVAIAAAVPKLDAIINLVGAICFSTLGLFIPVVINTVLILGDTGDFGFLRWKLWKNIFVAILAWIALISGSYYAIDGLVNGDD